MMSIESRVKEAQRVVQRELLTENCSVNMKPSSFNGRQISDKVFPVVVVSIPNVDDMSKITRKINFVIDEFDLRGSLSRSADGNGMVYSLYARNADEDDAPPLTFRDVVDEIKQMWKSRSFSL